MKIPLQTVLALLIVWVTTIKGTELELPSWLDTTLREARGKDTSKIFLDDGCMLKITNTQCISTIQPDGDNCRTIFNLKKLLKGYWKLRDFHKITDQNIPMEKFDANLLTVDNCNEFITFNANSTETINFLEQYLLLSNVSMVLTFKGYHNQVINNTEILIDLNGTVEFNKRVLDIHVYKNFNDSRYVLTIIGDKIKFSDLLVTFRIDRKFYSTFCTTIDKEVLDDLEFTKFQMKGVYNISKGFFLSATSVLKKSGSNDTSYIEVIIARARHKPLKLALILKGKLEQDILPFISDLLQRRRTSIPIIERIVDVGVLSISGDEIKLNGFGSDTHLDRIEKGIILQTVSSFAEVDKRSLIANQTDTRNLVRTLLTMCKPRDLVDFNVKSNVDISEFLQKLRNQDIDFPDWLKTENIVKGKILKVTFTGPNKNIVTVKSSIVTTINTLFDSLTLQSINVEFWIDKENKNASWDCGILKTIHKLSKSDVEVYLTCDKGLKNIRIVVSAPKFGFQELTDLLKVDVIPEKIMRAMGKFMTFDIQNFKVEASQDDDEFLRITGSPLLFGLKNLTMEGLSWIEDNEKKLVVGIVIKNIKLDDLLESMGTKKLKISWIGETKAAILISNTQLDSTSKRHNVIGIKPEIGLKPDIKNTSTVYFKMTPAENVTSNDTFNHTRNRRDISFPSYVNTLIPSQSPLTYYGNEPENGYESNSLQAPMTSTEQAPMAIMKQTSMASVEQTPAATIEQAQLYQNQRMFEQPNVNENLDQGSFAPPINDVTPQQNHAQSFSQPAYNFDPNRVVMNQDIPKNNDQKEVSKSVKSNQKTPTLMEELIHAYGENNQKKANENRAYQRQLNEGVLDEENDKRSILRRHGKQQVNIKHSSKVKKASKKYQSSKIKSKIVRKKGSKIHMLHNTDNANDDIQSTRRDLINSHYVNHNFKQNYLNWLQTSKGGGQRENIANIFDDAYKSNTVSGKSSVNPAQSNVNQISKTAIGSHSYKQSAKATNNRFPKVAIAMYNRFSKVAVAKNKPEIEREEYGVEREAVGYIPETSSAAFNLYRKENRPVTEIASKINDQYDDDDHVIEKGPNILSRYNSQYKNSNEMSHAYKIEQVNANEIVHDGYKTEKINAEDISSNDENSELIKEYARLNAQLAAMHEPTVAPLVTPPHVNKHATPLAHSLGVVSHNNKLNGADQMKGHTSAIQTNYQNTDTNELVHEYDRLNKQLATMNEPTVTPLLTEYAKSKPYQNNSGREPNDGETYVLQKNKELSEINSAIKALQNKKALKYGIRNQSQSDNLNEELTTDLGDVHPKENSNYKFVPLKINEFKVRLKQDKLVATDMKSQSASNLKWTNHTNQTGRSNYKFLPLKTHQVGFNFNLSRNQDATRIKADTNPNVLNNKTAIKTEPKENIYLNEGRDRTAKADNFTFFSLENVPNVNKTIRNNTGQTKTFLEGNTKGNNKNYTKALLTDSHAEIVNVNKTAEIITPQMKNKTNRTGSIFHLDLLSQADEIAKDNETVLVNETSIGNNGTSDNQQDAALASAIVQLTDATSYTNGNLDNTKMGNANTTKFHALGNIKENKNERNRTKTKNDGFHVEVYNGKHLIGRNDTHANRREYNITEEDDGDGPEGYIGDGKQDEKQSYRNNNSPEVSLEDESDPHIHSLLQNEHDHGSIYEEQKAMQNNRYPESEHHDSHRGISILNHNENVDHGNRILLEEGGIQHHNSFDKLDNHDNKVIHNDSDLAYDGNIDKILDQHAVSHKDLHEFQLGNVVHDEEEKGKLLTGHDGLHINGRNSSDSKDALNLAIKALHDGNGNEDVSSNSEKEELLTGHDGLHINGRNSSDSNDALNPLNLAVKALHDGNDTTADDTTADDKNIDSNTADVKIDQDGDKEKVYQTEDSTENNEHDLMQDDDLKRQKHKHSMKSEKDEESLEDDKLNAPTEYSIDEDNAEANVGKFNATKDLNDSQSEDEEGEDLSNHDGESENDVKVIDGANNDGGVKIESETDDEDYLKDDSLKEKETVGAKDNKEKAIDIQEDGNTKYITDFIDKKLKEQRKGDNKELDATADEVENDLSSLAPNINFSNEPNKNKYEEEEGKSRKLEDNDNISNHGMKNQKNKTMYLVKNKDLQVLMEIRPDSKTNDISVETEALPNLHKNQNKNINHNLVSKIHHKLNKLKQNYTYVDQENGFEDSLTNLDQHNGNHAVHLKRNHHQNRGGSLQLNNHDPQDSTQRNHLDPQDSTQRNHQDRQDEMMEQELEKDPSMNIKEQNKQKYDKKHSIEIKYDRAYEIPVKGEENIDDSISKSVHGYDDSVINEKYESIYRPSDKYKKQANIQLENGTYLENAFDDETRSEVTKIGNLETDENDVYLKNGFPRANILNKTLPINEQNVNQTKKETKQNINTKEHRGREKTKNNRKKETEQNVNIIDKSEKPFTKMDDIIEAYQTLNSKKEIYDAGKNNHFNRMDTKRGAIPETTDDAYNLYNSTIDVGEDLLQSDELKLSPRSEAKLKVPIRSKSKETSKHGKRVKEKKISHGKNSVKTTKGGKNNNIHKPAKSKHKLKSGDISKNLQESMEGRWHYKNPIEEAIREYLYPADDNTQLVDANEKHKDMKNIKKHKENKTSPMKLAKKVMHDHHAHHHHHHQHRHHRQHDRRDEPHHHHRWNHHPALTGSIIVQKEIVQSKHKIRRKGNSKVKHSVRKGAAKQKYRVTQRREKETFYTNTNSDAEIFNEEQLEQQEKHASPVNTEEQLELQEKHSNHFNAEMHDNSDLVDKHGNGNLSNAYSADYPGQQKDTNDIMESFNVWLNNTTKADLKMADDVIKRNEKEVQLYINNSTRKEVIGTTVKGKSKYLQFSLQQQKRNEGKINSIGRTDGNMNSIGRNKTNGEKYLHDNIASLTLTNLSRLSDGNLPRFVQNQSYLNHTISNNSEVIVRTKQVQLSPKEFSAEELKKIEIFQGVSLGIDFPTSDECGDNKMCLFIKEKLTNIDSLNLKGSFSKNSIKFSMRYPGQVEFTNAISLHDIVLLVDGNNGNMTIEAVLKIDDPVLRFQGKIYSDANGNLQFQMKMIGNWRNVFGIDLLTLGNAVLSSSYFPGAPMSRLELKGDLWFGVVGSGSELKIKIFFGFDTTDPSCNYIYGKTRELSMRDLLKAHNQSIILPQPIKKSAFPKGLLVAYTSNPNGIDITEYNIHVDFGFFAHGTIDILGYKVLCKIKFSSREVYIDAELIPLEFAGGLIKMYRSLDDFKNGPNFNIHVIKNDIFANAEGAASMLGFQADAYMMITNTAYEISLNVNLFDLLEGEVLVQASTDQDISAAKFMLESCLSINVEKLLEAITKNVNDIVEVSRKSIQRVNNKVKETGDIFSRAKAKLNEQEARIKEKQAQLNGETREILHNRHEVGANCFSDCPKVCQGTYVDDSRCIKTFAHWTACRNYKPCFKRTPNLQCILKCENEKFKKRGFNLLSKMSTKLKLATLKSARIALKFAKEFVKRAKLPLKTSQDLQKFIIKLVNVGNQITYNMDKDSLQFHYFCINANLEESVGSCVGFNMSVSLQRNEISMDGDMCLNSNMFDMIGNGVVEKHYPDSKRMKIGLKDKERDFENLEKFIEKAENVERKSKDKVENDKAKRLYIPSSLEQYYGKIIHEPEPIYSFHNDIISALYGHHGNDNNIAYENDEVNVENWKPLTNANNSCENLTHTLYSYIEIAKGLDEVLQHERLEKDHVMKLKKDIQDLLIRDELASMNMSNYDQQQYDWYESTLKRSYNKWINMTSSRLDERQKNIISKYVNELHNILQHSNINDLQQYMKNLHDQATTASKRSSIITTTMSEEENLDDIKKSFEELLFKNGYVNLEDKIEALTNLKRKLSLAQTFNKICTVNNFSMDQKTENAP